MHHSVIRGTTRFRQHVFHTAVRYCVQCFRFEQHAFQKNSQGSGCHGRVQWCMDKQNQWENKTYHFEDMHNQYLAVCKWVMDTEETRQRQTDGIRDEMLKANPAHQMATADNEWEGAEKSVMPVNRPPDCYGEKAELLWTRLPNDNSRLIKTIRICHGRWDWNPRKTQQRIARRYQGVVSDGRTFVHSWLNKESNGGSLWNAWSTPTTYPALSIIVKYSQHRIVVTGRLFWQVSCLHGGLVTSLELCYTRLVYDGYSRRLYREQLCSYKKWPPLLNMGSSQ